MRTGWLQLTVRAWQLDETWSVAKDGPRWYAYRADAAMLCDFPTVEGAMLEAERLREEDRPYEFLRRAKERRSMTEAATDPFEMEGE